MSNKQRLEFLLDTLHGLAESKPDEYKQHFFRLLRIQFPDPGVAKLIDGEPPLPIYITHIESLSSSDKTLANWSLRRLAEAV